ncbi:MAG: orotidine-5'-phosphate decarboxylase [Bacteroidota bacterium]
MTQTDLFRQIQKKQSFLCVGLDPDLAKIPRHLHREEDPIFAFNRQIIDATANYCVAYKPNIAFYESLGAKGWESLRKTLDYIPNDFFTIADAKRGDIGNTSARYAHTFFETYDFDSITVAPYMGEDSVTPFLQYAGKWVILLALTSNQGSNDFQHLTVGESQTPLDRQPLYQQVLETSQKWSSVEQMMYVVGATQAEKLEEIRKIVPNHFILVPGVGAQGGSLEEVARYGMNDRCGLLVNSARGIIYASDGEDFAEQAGKAAQQLQQQMAQLLENL